jgi:hypothetical protein
MSVQQATAFEDSGHTLEFSEPFQKFVDKTTSVTTEHQQHNILVPRKGKRTNESVASGGRPHEDNDGEEKIKLIKRSNGKR